ncbi:AraC family transcriptional regulator [Sphingomonas sp. UYAg733]
MIRRARHEFWGAGPSYREAAGFTFHRLQASAPEREVPEHTHDEAHFVLVLAGGYISSAVGAPLVSGTALLVFNPAGTTHRDRFHQGCGSFLAVSGGPEQQEGAAVAVLDPYAIWTAHRIAHEIADARLPIIGLDGCAHQLIATVQPLTSDEARDAACPPSWLKRAFEMSFTADDIDLSVADLAAEAGVHPVHLARVFKRYLMCSPGEHLRGRRLERAVAMLGKSHASLADVAHASGFADQAHFSRAFRTTFRSTPSAWRRARDVASLQDC